MQKKSFDKHFDYGSFLPLLLFIFGVYIIFLLETNKYSQAFFTMLIGFIVYVTNNIIINIRGYATVFNEYLEDMSAFLTFGISTIIFGLKFYENNLMVLVIIFFYAISLILALSRNWVLRFKNSLGWPIALNGLFFPLFYYIYDFYLKGPGDSVFIFIYIIVAFLSTSNYNFLGYRENNTERFSVVEVKERRKKNNDGKEVEKEDEKEDEKISENEGTLNDFVKEENQEHFEDDLILEDTNIMMRNNDDDVEDNRINNQINNNTDKINKLIEELKRRNS